MVAALAHRGPDGQGFTINSNVGLAHARLSIIDLVGGAQPMTNEDRSVWVTFNGEIYNYRELRATLQGYGHVFATDSDTEVLVHAWEQWGKDCVLRLRGMFAFGIVDLKGRQLFLARDHLGIKPLCYFRSGETFAFASEIQSLLALSDCPRAISVQALDDYLRLDYIPAPRTIYEGVYKLQPAHRLLLELDGNGPVVPERYWQVPLGSERMGESADWAGDLESVLSESVKAHLVSDVPFGAFLSGGIDSTAIVGLMSQQMSTPVRTFAIGFDHPDYDELDWASRAAMAFGTDHHEARLGADALDALPELVRNFGEPFGDSSALPTYFVARLARASIPMVLTGDGGDEAFLGYRRYVGWRSWVAPAKPARGLVKAAARRLLQQIMPEHFPEDIVSRAPRLDDWIGWMGGQSAADRHRIWRCEYHAQLSPNIEALEMLAADAVASCSPERFGQFLDYTSYLPDDVLTKVDIASMSHGLETRTPLVDVRVAEFAARMPWSVNLRQLPNGQWSGKYPLKQLVARRMGQDFVDRPKAGFLVPLRHWLNAKRGRELLQDALCSPDTSLSTYFDTAELRRLAVAQRSTTDADPTRMLWKLLFLENWLRDQSSAQARLAA